VLYFAYGSNMNHSQMADRCPTATLCGDWRTRWLALFLNQELERWSLRSRPLQGVEFDGVLWNLEATDERSLDQHEGVASGFYSQRAGADASRRRR